MLSARSEHLHYTQVITVPSASPEISNIGGCGGGGIAEAAVQQHGNTIQTSGGRMVLAKPLHPNHTLPHSIRNSLVSMANSMPGTSKFFFVFFLGGGGVMLNINFKVKGSRYGTFARWEVTE